MNAERWDQIRQKIKDTFSVIDEYEEDLDPGTSDVIEFDGPQGKLKASFITRPKVIDKKTLYSNRIGGGVRVDYQYSDTESVCHLSLFKWNEATQAWEEIRGQSLF